MTTKTHHMLGVDLQCLLPRENDINTYCEIFGDIDQYKLLEVCEHLTLDDTVIDLGAHIGLFSLAVSNFVKRVIAVEPNAENIDIFKKNILFNNLRNVTLVEKAISCNDKTETLYNSLLSPARHSFFLDYFFNFYGVLAKSVSVETICLNTLFITQKIDRCKLLKIDIEGAEYEALFHTSSEVFEKIDKILLALHYPIKEYKVDDLIEFLQTRGFHCEVEDPVTHSIKGYTLDETLVIATRKVCI